MLVLPLLAAAMIVAGVVTMVISTPQSASFGWLTHAPLSGRTFSPVGTVAIGCGAVAGAVVVALGIAGLAFWEGWTSARSRVVTRP